MFQKKEWQVYPSRINNRNAHKLVRFVCSFVISVTQLYKPRITWKASLQSIHPIRENTEDSLLKYTPRISIQESHNVSISAMLNWFNKIIAVRSVSAIFRSRAEAIRRYNHKLSPYAIVKKEPGHKGSTMMQAL